MILSPFLLAITIAIKTSSPGLVFFQQERVGLQGKVFQMWKFRTMVINADELQSQLETQNESEDGIMFKLKHDPRIRPVRNIISSLKCLHHKQYKEYNLFLMSHSFSSELN